MFRIGGRGSDGEDQWRELRWLGHVVKMSDRSCVRIEVRKADNVSVRWRFLEEMGLKEPLFQHLYAELRGRTASTFCWNAD